MFQNYGGYPPSYPNQPIIFIPSPGASQNAPAGFDINQVTNMITGLEQLKKVLKEDKKDDKKPDDKKGDTSIISMMLLMVLVSPITGPVMSWFFTQGTSLIHTVPK